MIRFGCRGRAAASTSQFGEQSPRYTTHAAMAAGARRRRGRQRASRLAPAAVVDGAGGSSRRVRVGALTPQWRLAPFSGPGPTRARHGTRPTRSAGAAAPIRVRAWASGGQPCTSPRPGGQHRQPPWAGSRPGPTSTRRHRDIAPRAEAKKKPSEFPQRAPPNRRSWAGSLQPTILRFSAELLPLRPWTSSYCTR